MKTIIVSIIIDSDLWSIPVRAVVRNDGVSYRITTGRLWRGLIVQAKTCKVLK